MCALILSELLIAFGTLSKMGCGCVSCLFRALNALLALVGLGFFIFGLVMMFACLSTGSLPPPNILNTTVTCVGVYFILFCGIVGVRNFALEINVHAKSIFGSLRPSVSACFNFFSLSVCMLLEMANNYQMHMQ